MPKKKPIKCDVCGRRFALPLHLARHKSATHQRRPAAAKPPRAARRPGRRPRLVSSLGLSGPLQSAQAALLSRRAAIQAELAAIEKALAALRV